MTPDEKAKELLAPMLDQTWSLEQLVGVVAAALRECRREALKEAINVYAPLIACFKEFVAFCGGANRFTKDIEDALQKTELALRFARIADKENEAAAILALAESREG